MKKLTFTEVYERWCRQKFKDASVNPVYVAAYKNLAALQEMTFSRIRKRRMQAAIDTKIVAKLRDADISPKINRLILGHGACPRELNFR